MSKHTPAPWQKCGFNISVAPDCYYLLKNNSLIKSGELQANARLMVAAPDLLKALEKIASYPDDHSEDKEMQGVYNRMGWRMQEIAEDAIKKVESRK